MNLNPLTNVSIIILAVEAMICLLIPLALTIGLAYLMVRTRQFLPPKFHLVRLQFHRVDEAVDKSGDAMTRPLIALETRLANMEAGARYARSVLNLRRKTTKE